MSQSSRHYEQHREMEEQQDAREDGVVALSLPEFLEIIGFKIVAEGDKQ